MLQQRYRIGFPTIAMGPATMAGASLGLTAVGTGLNFLGGMSSQSAQQQQAQQQQAWGIYQQQVQAAAQSKQAAYERELAQTKIGILKEQKDVLATEAEQAVSDVAQRALVTDFVTRKGTQQKIGSQIAAAAAQGTDLSGDPAYIIADTAAAGEFDARTKARDSMAQVTKIRNNAARAAYGLDLGIWDEQNNVNVAQAKQDNARPGLVSASSTSSGVAPYASLLSGASSLAEKWWRFQQQGPIWGGSSTFTDTSYGGAGGLGTINGTTFG